MTGRGTLLVVLSLGVAAAVAGISAPAVAKPTKKQCVEDNAAAQDLRRSGHFADATERLSRCAVRSCPAIVRDDCTSRLDDLKAAQPSLVFQVLNPFGMDVVSVRVSMDGQVLTDRLDGTPLKVDPGSHAFTFEAPGQPTVTERLLVREGEAARPERVVIGTAPPVVATPMPAVAPSATDAEPPRRSRRQVLGLSAAGVGVAGVVVGTIFGLLARSAWNDAKRACGGDTSHCLDVSAANGPAGTARTDGTVSTVAFIAGGALLVGGAILYLKGGRTPDEKPTNVALIPSVELERVGVILRGVF